jgi:hypothetical protein
MQRDMPPFAFLPLISLVSSEKLKPWIDLVGVNKDLLDSYWIGFACQDERATDRGWLKETGN